MAGFADLNVPQGPDKKGLQSLLEAAARRESGSGAAAGPAPGRAGLEGPGQCGGSGRPGVEDAGLSLLCWVGVSSRSVNPGRAGLEGSRRHPAQGFPCAWEAGQCLLCLMRHCPARILGPPVAPQPL